MFPISHRIIQFRVSREHRRDISSKIFLEKAPRVSVFNVGHDHHVRDAAK
jgi:hypothetical protein